jgi:hypothetical protein
MRRQFSIFNLQSAIAAALLFLAAAPSFASQTLHRHLEPETVVYQGLSAAAQTQFVTNENLKSIKYGSGITLASITANFSLVDGTAFVTNPSVDLRAYVGFKLTTNDGSVGYVKAAGTGETLGTELSPNNTAISDGVAEANATTGWGANSSPTTFESTGTGTPHSGSYHFHIVATGANKGFQSSPAIGTTSGWLTKHVVWGLSTGEPIHFNVYNSTSATLLANTGSITPLTYASSTLYATAIDAGVRLLGRTFGTNLTTFYADTFSAKQVLAPSATGVTIVTTAGGSTYNWAAKGTTPNAASFTFSISRN